MLAGLADNYGEGSWNGSFVGDFAERFPKETHVLIKLQETIGKKPEWDDINNQSLTALRAYLLKNYTKGTAKR